jgi:DNA-directed RNA polymerase subunit alpha
MSETPNELSAFFEASTLDADSIRQFAETTHDSFKAWQQFDGLTRAYAETVESGSGDPLRLGVALFILSRHKEALQQFEAASAGALRDYYMGRAAMGLGRYSDALTYFENAAKAGWDAFDVEMRCVEALVLMGDRDAAEQRVAKHDATGADRPEWHYAKGLLAEEANDRVSAIEHFEKALTLRPEYEEAMFRSALMHDMLGNDHQAIERYEALAKRPRAHVNALMNLAVVFEDNGRFGDAMRCIKRVLRVNPNHTRARLFLKDVESSQSMVIDEAADERADARARLLDAPIGEFELSVRARNCLKKMNIHTLGQLVQLSEAELLAYKNFGEASLTEIKQLLSRKGLRLGQRIEDIDPATVEEDTTAPRVEVPPGREAVLSKSVSELELSVRSRRCLQRLNVQTVGDLVQYSEADLMAARNFGVTSLNEIKSKLGDIGLTLAPKRAE